METVRLDREITETRAPNGVVVLSERVASVRSAAVGVWVRTASGHESRGAAMCTSSSGVRCHLPTAQVAQPASHSISERNGAERGMRAL